MIEPEFTQEEIGFFYESGNAGTVQRLDGNKYTMRVGSSLVFCIMKTGEGYDVFCADTDYSIQVRTFGITLVEAMNQASSLYFHKAFTVNRAANDLTIIASGLERYKKGKA